MLNDGIALPNIDIRNTVRKNGTQKRCESEERNIQEIERSQEKPILLKGLY